MSHTRIAAMTLMAAVLAVSGCGGSKSSSTKTSTTAIDSHGQRTVSQATPSSPPLGRTQMITTADAICARVNAKRLSITLLSNHDYATKLPALVAYQRAALVDLAKLSPPTSIATDWAQLLAGMRSINAATAQIVQYAKVGNNKAAQTLVMNATQVQRRTTGIATQDGFKQCGITTG